MHHRLRSLYISYFPLTDPLVQTQVVAYLAGLARRGHTIHLLTYETEPLTAEFKRHWRRTLKQQGIAWHGLAYHSRPTLPATIYDTLAGILLGLKLVHRHRLDMVHARAHVPAAMGLALKRLTGCGLLFDIRGLVAEEYADAGRWDPAGLPFRITKWVERVGIAHADGAVVLTARAREVLFPTGWDRPLRVIPCCADLSAIEAAQTERATVREDLGLGDRQVMIYVGKFGSWYMLPEMISAFKTFRELDSRLHFLVLSQTEHELFHEEAARQGIGRESYTILRAAPDEVGRYLAAADFAISFIRACYSKLASSPTKIGEYLAAGLPVLSAPGIGDIDSILLHHRAGVMTAAFEEDAYRRAFGELQSLLQDAGVKDRCREAARRHASLQETGIPLYDELYGELAARRAGESAPI